MKPPRVLWVVVRTDTDPETYPTREFAQWAATKGDLVVAYVPRSRKKRKKP